MSIATEITRLNTNKEALATAKTAIASAITEKGGTVASGDGFADFATDIASIPSGGGTKQLTVKPIYSNSGTQNTLICPPGQIDELIVDATDVADWGGAVRIAGIKKHKIIMASGYTRTSLSMQFQTVDDDVIEEIDILPNTTNILNFNQTFRLLSNLKKITNPIDFTSATNVSNIFMNCLSLEYVRFVQSSLKISMTINTYAKTVKLTNDSLVSIANGLDGTVTGKTLSIDRVYLNYIGTIVGSVTDDVFVEEVGGQTTLSNFIGSTKGWTLASV